MTRYDLGYEKSEKFPINSANIRLKNCNAFNMAMEAARQCRGLTPLNRVIWPTNNDFMKRSKRCQKVIELFHSKVNDWLGSWLIYIQNVKHCIRNGFNDLERFGASGH